MIFNDDIPDDNTPEDTQDYDYDVDDKMIIMLVILIFLMLVMFIRTCNNDKKLPLFIK